MSTKTAPDQPSTQHLTPITGGGQTQSPGTTQALVSPALGNGQVGEDTLLEETEALIKYAAEQGVLVDASQEQQFNFAKLKSAACEYREASTEAEKYASRLELLKQYSSLTRLTGLVTGRSVIECEHVNEHLWLLIGYTVLFLLAVLFDATATPGAISWLESVQKFSPFFWGGLGSSVFLLKSLSDKVRERRFDSRSLQGWQTRIWLGAILGLVVAYIYGSSEGSGAGVVGVDSNIVAFLTGLGVKVVYGAIEKTIDQLAEKFNLGSLRKPTQPQT